MTQRGKRIVLVGAGHAHIEAVRHAAALRRAGAEVLLINPAPRVPYSSTAVGMLAGVCELEQIRLPVRRWIEAGGGEFLAARADKIDAEAREIWAAGRRWTYDLASIDIGSETPMPGVLACPSALSVRPLENLLEMRRRLEAMLAGAGRTAVAVVGAGPAGVECSLAMAALARRMGKGSLLQLTLIEQADRILPQLPDKAGRLAVEALSAGGAEIAAGRAAVGYDGAELELSDGQRRRADLLLYAGPPRVPPLLAESNLPIDHAGAVRVDEALRVVGHADLLAGGDCATLEYGPELTWVGVHAIRQGSVIRRNLRRLLAGKEPRRYEPQQRYLQILNLCDGRGLAIHGRRVYAGRAMMWIKSLLDRRFLRRYQIG